MTDEHRGTAEPGAGCEPIRPTVPSRPSRSRGRSAASVLLCGLLLLAAVGATAPVAAVAGAAGGATPATTAPTATATAAVAPASGAASALATTSDAVLEHDDVEDVPPEEIEGRDAVANTTELPYSAVGDLETGTGVLISEYHVLTAAHVVLEDGQIERELAFTPGYDEPPGSEGTAPYGHAYAAADDVTLHPDYLELDTAEVDLAIVELDRPIGRYAGYMDVGGWSGDPALYDLRQAGYPGLVAGTRQLTTEPTYLDHGNSGLTADVEYCAPTSNGDSGAPLWRSVDGTPTVLGIHAMAAHSSRCPTQRGHGPRLAGEQLALVESWTGEPTPDLRLRSVDVEDPELGEESTVTVAYANEGAAGETYLEVAARDPDTGRLVEPLAHERIEAGSGGATRETTLTVTPEAVAGDVEVVVAARDGGQRWTNATYGPTACADFDGTEACDANGDGFYRDLTANGVVGQADVLAFFRVQHRDGVADETAAFDYTGDGSVGHGDVVALFYYVATR